MRYFKRVARPLLMVTSVAWLAGPVAAQEDAAVVQAKAAVEKKLKDPPSALFADLKRATRRNLSNEPTDVVCGFVSASEFASRRPFVYLVGHNTIFIVLGSDQDGTPEAVVYRTYCE